MKSGEGETGGTATPPRAEVHFGHAVDSYLGHRGDLSVHLDATIAADPDHIGAHCLSGFAQLFLGRAALVPAARASLAAAHTAIARNGASAWDRDLVAALAHWCGGEMEASVAVLGSMLARAPCDALVLKLDHALRFMLGDAHGMRSSLERSLPRWDRDAHHYGFILGCHAFALEESGAFAEAEGAAAEALARNPCDVWAGHAFLHLHEMRGTPARGIAFLHGWAPRWHGINNFVRHLHWHWALFHLTRGETDRALALYDSAVREARTDDYRDIANAVSLLLRLEALGIDVGRRWSELGDLAEAHFDDHALAFAALHYLIALVHDRRMGAAWRFLSAMESDARRGLGTQARILAAIGLPLAQRVLAARPSSAAQSHLHAAIAQLGGSRVQRQTFERLLASSPADALSDRCGYGATGLAALQCVNSRS